MKIKRNLDKKYQSIVLTNYKLYIIITLHKNYQPINIAKLSIYKSNYE